MNKVQKRKRIVFLDTIRGIAIVYMLFFHTLFDLSEMFMLPWANKLHESQKVCVPYFLGTFVFLAGITVRQSRNAAKHGARLLCIAAVFTIVTAFIFPGYGIYFGMLHLAGTSMLVWSVFGDVFNKIPWYIGTAISALLFSFTYNCKYGYFGIKGIFTIAVPEALKMNNLLNAYGFLNGQYASVDYTPLLPWMFLFLAGAFAGGLLTRELPERFYKSRIRPLEWVGEHSLTIYILHQPIIFVLLYAIFNIF